MRKPFIILLCFFLIGCAFSRHQPITEGVNNDTIHLGMTRLEIQNILGKPERIEKRKTIDNIIEETWVYYEYEPPKDTYVTVLIGILTVGLFFFAKPAPEEFYLLFRGNELTEYKKATIQNVQEVIR